MYRAHGVVKTMKSNFVPLFYSIILRTLRSPSVLGYSNPKNKRINVFPFLGHPVFVLISILIKLLCKNSRELYCVF